MVKEVKKRRVVPGARPPVAVFFVSRQVEVELQFMSVDPGEYNVSCRTIDANGIAQPMPRPFRKS
jgi:hypothetical protein